ncbi:MAG: hypothetical protein JW795_21415 [Chitinivibrionales bacterium]|nr:hypothetical protein [Chitinivibrionales bacterium]
MVLCAQRLLLPVKICGIIFCISLNADSRLFFVGSNPYMSYIAFPQDILDFSNDFIYYYTTFQRLPWWGDVDEPTKKPNDSYISTAQKTVHAQSATSFFDHGASISVLATSYGIACPISTLYRSYSEMSYALDYRSIKSTGNLNNATNGTTVPYEYDANNSNSDFGIRTTIASTRWRNIPIGLKLQFGFNNTTQPQSSIEFTKTINGTARTFESTKLLWGWSTAPCSHIFGAQSPDGDAWLQNEFAVGPLYRFDIQAGATLPKAKIGSRLRYIVGKQDQYSWQVDSSQLASVGDNTVWSNFIGSYVKSNWAKKSSDAIFRAYSNVFWKKNDHYSLNTLFFLGGQAYSNREALSEDLSIVDDRKYSLKSIVLEANPNINIYAPKVKASFIDAALLFEYCYTRHSNTGPIWLPSGGDKEFYVSSTVYPGLEYSWENYSYANESFFDAGLDMSMNVPLFMNGEKRVALGLLMFLNSKFTYQTKYFGTSTASGSDADFTVTNLRKNYKREFWFNSALSLNYWFGNTYIRAELTEPLLYSLLPRTRVTDSKGRTVVFENKRAGTWASQEGVKVGFFIMRSISLKNHDGG